MKIEKGTKLMVRHDRKGKFVGIADRDFDTDETFYPIRVAKGNGEVTGIKKTWGEGRLIPCRNTFCEVEIIS